jgi:hypothetical protein
MPDSPRDQKTLFHYREAISCNLALLLTDDRRIDGASITLPRVASEVYLQAIRSPTSFHVEGYKCLLEAVSHHLK